MELETPSTSFDEMISPLITYRIRYNSGVRTRIKIVPRRLTSRDENERFTSSSSDALPALASASSSITYHGLLHRLSAMMYLLMKPKCRYAWNSTKS